ncbi:hypothetical protein PAPYR_310 [Paratrimastix pyriformis]|uniref:Uncharacterized protein n=1 Tax=Paratrimastix pyriformis TaxID=342808 RepID=A0ABQ8UVD8_9EUKA|nr:hypothetical protein PAPYR_310 [Paratrimastix pyriformis]
MLTRDEEQNLARTLPRWAKIIDCYVIGVDVLNKPTDHSEDVIRRTLAGIPGVIVKINFEGMGPSWSKLMEAGREACPNVTHGILADADFAPINTDWDKSELDPMCSKHSFKIWSEDGLNERTLDWIYRNIPGSVVKRRTHQTVEVPPIPGQTYYQTMVSLRIEESAGYGDRAGGKNERYIEMLKADLADLPDDPRTLYYLGYAHFDIFNKNQGPSSPPRPSFPTRPIDRLCRSLAPRGVEYLKRRVALTSTGYYEERFFAMIKLGEIYERFYRNLEEAVRYYRMAADFDPERADAWFYWVSHPLRPSAMAGAGQIYRLAGQPENAYTPALRAAATPLPVRSLFQWRYMYDCLAPLELARVTLTMPNPTASQIREALPHIARGLTGCGGGAEAAEMKGALEALRNHVVLKVPPCPPDPTPPCSNLAPFLVQAAGGAASVDPPAAAAPLRQKAASFAALEGTLGQIAAFEQVAGPRETHPRPHLAPLSLWGIQTFPLQEGVFSRAGEAELWSDLMDAFAELRKIARVRVSVLCRDFRAASGSFLREWPSIAPRVAQVLAGTDYNTQWEKIAERVGSTCR